MGWHDETPEAEYYGEDIRVPEDIRDVLDNICEKVLRCKVTQKYYKITPQEFRFYRKMKLPLPTRCPDQRHLDRLELRNPQRLWQRSCDKCGKGIATTYAPDKTKIVYCRECYLKDM
jgi:CxxC-x17-CxxC domain-containing protein